MTRQSTDGRVTRAEVLEALRYDLETGVFTWRRKNRRYQAGDIAGTTDSKGYLRISINGTQFPAHRLAWLYVSRSWPCRQIDHINRVKNDNRFINLRLASNSQNNAAKPISKLNKSGAKGVSWNIRRSRWQVFIRIDGKNKNLGCYADIEQAKVAYKVAAKIIHGEFANTEAAS